MVSCVITGHLVAELRIQEEFWKADHNAYLQEGRAELRKRSVLQAEEALAETLSGYPVQDARRLWWAKNTGSWLMVQPSTVYGTKLGGQEWQNALFLRYDLDPPDLPKYCNGCNSTFYICNALG